MFFRKLLKKTGTSEAKPAKIKPKIEKIVLKSEEILEEYKENLRDIPRITYNKIRIDDSEYNLLRFSLTISGKNYGIIFQKKQKRSWGHDPADYIRDLYSHGSYIPEYYDFGDGSPIRLDASKIVFILHHVKSVGEESDGGYPPRYTYDRSEYFDLAIYDIDKQKLKESRLGTYYQDSYRGNGSSANYKLIPIENCSTQFILMKNKTVASDWKYKESSKFFVHDISTNKKQTYDMAIDITRAAISKCKQYIVMTGNRGIREHLIVLKNGAILIHLSNTKSAYHFTIAPDGSLVIIVDKNIQKIDLKTGFLTPLGRHDYKNTVNACYFDENGIFIVINNEYSDYKGNLQVRYQLANMSEYMHAAICNEMEQSKGMAQRLFTPLKRIVADYCVGEIDKPTTTLRS